MENCYNIGKITSTEGRAGGIAGAYAGQIIGCYNLGNIISQYYGGGILGQSTRSITITNCYNTGDVLGKSYWHSGGIVGDEYENATVNNCYNTGNITNKYGTGTAEGINGTSTTNCYNIGKLYGANLNIIGGTTVNNCYYFSSLTDSKVTIESGAIDVAGKTSEEFVELLNSYTNDEGVYPEGWKKWKVGENGYPTFE